MIAEKRKLFFFLSLPDSSAVHEKHPVSLLCWRAAPAL